MTDLMEDCVSLRISIVAIEFTDRKEDPVALRIIPTEGMIGRENLARQTDFGGSDRHDRYKNSPNRAPREPHAAISSPGPFALHAKRLNVIAEASAARKAAMRSRSYPRRAKGPPRAQGGPFKGDTKGPSPACKETLASFARIRQSTSTPPPNIPSFRKITILLDDPRNNNLCLQLPVRFFAERYIDVCVTLPLLVQQVSDR